MTLWQIRLERYAKAVGRTDSGESQETSGDLSEQRPSFDPVEKRCTRLLALAQESVALGSLDNGWEYLQEMEREMLSNLSKEELQSRWISATEEAGEKLDKWRKCAATKLLQGKCTDLANLREVLLHVHTRSQNLYRNIRRFRIRVAIVALCVTVMVSGILVLNQLEFFASLGPGVRDNLPLGVLLGLLGGILSVAYSEARTDPKQKFPETMTSSVVTLVRPVMGAAVALPVLLFVASDILKVESQVKLYMVLVFCFMAGFSERWFLGFMEKLEKRNT